MPQRPVIWITAALMVLPVLAGCARPQTTPVIPGGDVATASQGDGAATSALPTNLPISTSTLNPNITPTNADAFGVPLDLSGHELIAQAAGESVYSGYQCVIAADAGCACEIPILVRVGFTFKPGQRMDYHFAGDQYEATWEMTDLGPSQWGYTQNLRDELTGDPFTVTSLLTFTDTGFIRTDAARFANNAIVTCPDVTFRRLAMPTAEPNATASPAP